MAERESIEGVFSNLASVLYAIKDSSNMSERNTRYHLSKIDLQIIKDKIWGFPANTALSNIHLALKDISEIKSHYAKKDSIEPKFDAEIPKYAFDDEGRQLFTEEGKEVKLPTRKESYELEMRMKESNEKEIKDIEVELLNIEDKLNETINLLETSGKNKLKLNLSVDDMGTLFRGLKEAGIIDMGNTPLSRFIVQNFESKSKDNLSEKNVKNKLDAPSGSSANSVLSILDKTAHEIKILRDK